MSSSQFQLENELQSALRMDTNYSTSSSQPTASSSRRAPLVASSAHNRSQSESRLAAALLRPAKKDTSNPSRQRARSKTPTRSSGNLSGFLDASGAGTSFRDGRRGLSVSGVSPSRMGGADRFIINRSTTDMEMAHHHLKASRENLLDATAGEEGANNVLPVADMDELSEQMRRQKMSDVLNDTGSNGASVAGTGDNGHRILSFSQKATAADEAHSNNLKVLYSTGKPTAPSAKKTRQVTSHPEKVLDAPEMKDDFYLHLIDWSATNMLAVVLGPSCFVWNASDGSIEELFSRENEGDSLSSISWAQEGGILAAADDGGQIELWDACDQKFLRRMVNVEGERAAVTAWNAHVLAAGSASGTVQLHDVRVANHMTSSVRGHTLEVCGMAWSHDGNMLATGANDNLVQLWDKRSMGDPVQTFNQHQSAIKAISWCPWHSNTLATAGGTGDRTIKFWNTSNGALLNSVNAGSQVSSLVWNSEYRELVSGHGFSHNQLTLWKYPQMTKVSDLKGHTSRILLVVPSPDGTTVASAAGDETIRLWKLWPKTVKNKDATKSKAKEAGKMFSQRIIR